MGNWPIGVFTSVDAGLGVHLDVVQERLKREFDLSLILSAPSVLYRVELKDGTVLQGWGRVRGLADNPVPREEVVEKFRKMTTPHISGAAQEELIMLCAGLETVADATRLVELMEPQQERMHTRN